MSFLTDTLARAALKRMSGKAHTSNTKDLANESESSFFTIAAGDVYADTIPNNISAAVAAGVATNFISLELTLDPSSNGKAYFASIASVASSPLLGKINPLTGVAYADNDRVGYLIPPQYGSEFRAILKNNGAEVSPSSAEDWLLDYTSGIVTSEDDLELVSGTIEASVYIGRFLDDVIATHDLYTLQADGYGVFTKGPGAVDGYSTVPGNVGIGSSTPSDKLTVSLAATGGIAINNSSTNDPTIKLKLSNTDIFVMGVDNSDSDKYKLERGSDLGMYNDFVINQTDGYVSMGTATSVLNSRLTVSDGNISVTNGGFVINSDDQFFGMSRDNGAYWNSSSGAGALNFRGSGYINIDSDNNTSSAGFFIGKDQPGPTSSDNLFSVLESGNTGVGTPTPVSKLSVVSATQSGTQTTFTQDLASAGVVLISGYTNNAYTPGIFWATNNDSATKPKAGIYTRLTSSGSSMFFGTSNSYSVGITNDALIINHAGSIGIGTTPVDKLEINNGATAINIFTAKENGTNVFILPDGMTAPVQNNSILTATTSAIATWSEPQDHYINSRISNFIHFEDFVLSDGHPSSVIADGTVLPSGYLVQIDAGGTATAVIDGVDGYNHPGVIALSCTSAAGGDYATIMLGATSPFAIGSGQSIDITTYIKINDLNASNTYVISFGLTDTNDGDPDLFTSGSDHVILFYDSGSANWQSVVNGSYNTSGVTTATGWNKLQLRFTGGTTSVDFVINDVVYSRTGITLPTGTDHLRLVVGVKKILLNVTTFTISVDYASVSITGINR